MKRGEVLEKESYNIDDILAEVKKHKEEQEKREHPEKFSETEKTEDTEDTNKTSDDEKEEEPVQINDDENVQVEDAEKEEEFEIQEISKSADSEEEEKEADISGEKAEKSEKQEKKPETKKPEKKEPVSKPQDEKEELNIVEKKAEKAEPVPEENETDKNTAEEENQQEEKLQPDENGMVDILKLADNRDDLPELKKKEKVKFFKTRKGKIVKNAILCVVIILIIACIAGVIILNNMLNNVAETEDQEETYNAVTYYEGMDFLQEDFPLIEEAPAYEIYSYKEYLKSWYENGDPVRSSHVLNVLLIGEDTREEEISEASRADSAIIASINIDTGVIHMTSILRDLYVYYEVDGEGYYGKINESASNGGINTYITTVERNYKIAIDGYAIVNFASFPKIIDALGGVDINITEAEINEINNHPNVYDDVGEVYIEKTFEGTEGVMTLDGLQALAYCRIRHIDGDDKRADRQKTVLSQILSEVKASSTLDAVKAVNQLSKYTKTSYSKKELISIGNLALRDNWLGYTIQSNNVPAVENRDGGQYFSVSYNNWIWLADIPKDAYDLQTAIYGKSNIQLSENRADYISMGQ